MYASSTCACACHVPSSQSNDLFIKSWNPALFTFCVNRCMLPAKRLGTLRSRAAQNSGCSWCSWRMVAAICTETLVVWLKLSISSGRWCSDAMNSLLDISLSLSQSSDATMASARLSRSSNSLLPVVTKWINSRTEMEPS